MSKSDDLGGRVTEWLSRQGYPLEMRVASAFRSEGFSVSQSTYYADPESGNNREIDVVATRTDPIGFLQVSVVIECKSSKDKPWILFTCQEQGNRFFNFGMLSEQARGKLVDKLFADKNGILSLPWFVKSERNGYGLTVAFGSGDDPAYKAVLNALKAAIEVYREQADAMPLRFVFPVVVVEGRLFEASLDDEGAMAVSEIDDGFLTTFRSISGHYCSSVHVVTDRSIPALCVDTVELVNRLETLLKADLDLMLEELKRPPLNPMDATKAD